MTEVRRQMTDDRIGFRCRVSGVRGKITDVRSQRTEDRFFEFGTRNAEVGKRT